MYAGASNSDQSVVSTNRIVNIVLIVLFSIVLVLHIVCLSVVAAKNHEFADKWNELDPVERVSENDVCVFFIDEDHLTGDANKCHLIIYGSGVLAGCALLMIIFLVIRTVMFKQPNYLRLLDLSEVVITGTLAVVIAVFATIGTNKSCDTFTGIGGESKCSDEEDHVLKIYSTMIAAVVTSWIAVAIMLALAVFVAVRVFLLIIRRNVIRMRETTAAQEMSFNKLHDDHVNDDY